jgi:hypothetical protein
MRLALLLPVLAAASIGSAQPSLASYEGPWCAYRQLGGGFIERNCGMVNYEQCRANIFATPGTWCTQNPWYVPSPAPVRRKAKAKRARSR